MFIRFVARFIGLGLVASGGLLVRDQELFNSAVARMRDISFENPEPMFEKTKIRIQRLNMDVARLSKLLEMERMTREEKIRERDQD